MVKNPFDDEREKTRQQKEFRLQCHIVKLHQHYFSNVLMTAFPGRPGDAQDGFFKKMMGVKPGIPDILLWWDTDKLHAGAVEIKVDARISNDQNKVISTMHGMGIHTGVARSWQEYYKLLCSFGVKPVYVCTRFEEPDYSTEQQRFKKSFDFFAP